MSAPGQYRYRLEVESLENRSLPSYLNAAVLAFAESHLGLQVGNGQCTELAIEALRSAGARGLVGTVGPMSNYVWGQLAAEAMGGGGGGQAVLGSFDNMQPGDVIQFSHASFVLNTPTYWSDQEFPHHTAIIEANLGNGRFEILQQNVNGNMTVQRGVIDFSQMTSGVVWVYQPVAK
jgi:hypothetical protein